MTPPASEGVIGSGTPSRSTFRRKASWALGILSLAAAVLALSVPRSARPPRPLPTRPEPELVRRFDGGHPGDFFGSWIATGDLDGDGVPEAVAGAPEDDSYGANRGRAVVYSGRTGEIRFEIGGDADEVYLGERVGVGPDLNGDGTPDVLVRARAHQTKGDRVLVASGTDGAVFREFNAGRDADELGTWFVTLPDLDGDGVAEVGVGAPGRWDAPVAGRAHVFSGRTGAIVRTFQGPDRPFDRFGFSMAEVGDQNADGVVDLAVASLDGEVSRQYVGAVRVFSLADGRLLSTLHGTAPQDHFGHELATLPDMDRDGRAELLVGAFRLNDIGYVRAIDPITGRVHRELRSDRTGDGFGHAVAVVGDVDGDGGSDWAVGAPNAPHPPSGYRDVGRVDVFSGTTGQRLASMWGHREQAHFGYAVAAAGDLDGDGRAEALVASVVAGASPGHARIVAPARLGEGTLAVR